jgi:hypothetical protein
LQAGGQEFDPPQLHQIFPPRKNSSVNLSRDEFREITLFDNSYTSNKVDSSGAWYLLVLAHNSRLRKKLGIDLVGKTTNITERIKFVGQATKGLCMDDLVR